MQTPRRGIVGGRTNRPPTIFPRKMGENGAIEMYTACQPESFLMNSTTPGRIFCVVLSSLAASAAWGQTVVFHGLVHDPLGRATLSIISGNTLHVDNIGSSGLDGVRIELGQANSFDSVCQPLPSGLPVGAARTITAIGSVNGVSGVTLGRLKGAINGNTTISFTADFSGVGSFSRRVEIYNSGTLVLAQSNITGPLAATVPPNQWPTTNGIRRSMGGAYGPGFVCHWQSPVVITLPNGMLATGDELRAVSENPSAGVDFVAVIDDQPSDVPELFIFDEIVDPLCDGDLDGDNDVDLGDMAILLSNYGKMDATREEGDLDGSSVVDLADLALLLALYGLLC